MWWLPLRDPQLPDPEYDGLLEAVYDAEDRPSGLHAEFVLLIFLMTRNYDLPADVLNALLSFPAGDPALTQLQASVHELVIESARLAHQAKGSAPRPGQARETGNAPRIRSERLMGPLESC